MSFEVTQIRRHVQSRLAELKRVAATRRDRVAAAERFYGTFLPEVAVPMFSTVAQTLTAENYPYKVLTPGNTVRMLSERSNRTFVELRLDTSLPTPTLVAEVGRERGSRVSTTDRVVAEGVALEAITDEHVLEFLLDVMAELIER
jgi:hypothetical protein